MTSGQGHPLAALAGARDFEPAPGMGRRGLIKASALLTGLLLAQGPIALLAPSLAWAMDVYNIDQPQADTILRMARVLYPHQGLEDAVYALVVKVVDKQAADPAAKRQIAAGIAAMDAKAGGAWLTAPADRQHDIVAALIGDPFVQSVRSTCITTLYDNDMAFAHFGYEGEAFSKGGYLHRGFNDLQWLPAPPSSASPAPHSA